MTKCGIVIFRPKQLCIFFPVLLGGLVHLRLRRVVSLDKLLAGLGQHFSRSQPLLVHDPDILERLALLKEQRYVLLPRILQDVDGQLCQLDVLAVNVDFAYEVEACHSVQPLRQLTHCVCLIDHYLDVDGVVPLLLLQERSDILGEGHALLTAE